MLPTVVSIAPKVKINQKAEVLELTVSDYKQWKQYLTNAIKTLGLILVYLRDSRQSRTNAYQTTLP